MQAIFKYFELNLWVGLATISIIFLTWTWINYRKKYSFWSKQGISGPTPLPFLGNTLDFIISSPLVMDQERIEKYGLIHGKFYGVRPVLVVADPNVLKKIFIKDFNVFSDRTSSQKPGVAPDPSLPNLSLSQVSGEEWRRQRSIMTPTFTSGKMRHMFPLMSSCVVSLIKTLDEKADSKEDVEMKHVFGCYTMDE